MAIVKITRTKDFVVDAAAFILEQARKAIAERNEFRIALSGGHTPAPVYAHIASGTRDFRWESVRFTFGTSVACRRMIRKAISVWRAKIFLCLPPFPRNR